MNRAAGFALLVLTSWSTLAATYYVSPTGNDAGPGTQAQPWRTIQHAANTMVAGDTVYVMAGTYAEQVVPQASGAPGAEIVYGAFPGAAPVIDGATVALPAGLTGLFHIQGLSYIRVQGMRVVNAGPDLNNAGFLVNQCSFIALQGNATHNTVSSGIGVWNSSDVLVAGNDVAFACNDGEQECISIAVTDRFEVRDNRVHDSGPGTNGGEGICLKDGSANGSAHNNEVFRINSRVGIYLDAWDKHTYAIDVYGNDVHDNVGEGIALTSEAGGLLEDVDVFNNLSYRNASNGIAMGNWGNPGVSRPVRDVRIVNNTIQDNGSATWGGGIQVENPAASNLDLRNNIVSQNVWFTINVEVPIAGLTVDFNLIDGFRGYPTETRGTNYVEGNPLLQNPASGDFHLTGASPAIDAGSATNAPAEDYDGTSRPLGAGYDIGAYEYGAGPSGVDDVVVGMGFGAPNANRIRVFVASGAPTPVDFLPYAAGTYGVGGLGAPIAGAGGVRILTGPGPGPVLGPQVRAFLSDGTPIAGVNFYAYGTLRYGVNAAAGDVDGDGFAEIVSGAGAGAVFGPHVRGFNHDGAGLSAIAKISYFAYGTLKYGVNPAGARMDGDGFDEILTGPGPGAVFRPQVRGWNYDGAAIASISKINFDAFPTPQFGVCVTGGSVDADSFAEIVGAPGPGAGAGFPPRFRGFDYDGVAVAPAPGYDLTLPTGTAYGGRVGLAELTGDGRAELLAGLGRDPAADANTRAYSYTGGTLTLTASFNPFWGAAYGANPSGGDLGY